MKANWGEFWMCETEMGQQVAQLRGTYMMVMITTTNYSSKQQIVQSINLLI
jgi:hypothetical protein